MNKLTLSEAQELVVTFKEAEDAHTAVTSRAPSALKCRIQADIQPVKSVLEVLEGMREWYNGYEFLWARGGWTGETYVPDQYREAIDMPARAARFNYLFGWNNNPEVITSACVMQVARWYAGYGRNESWNTDRIYWATARALASNLGHDAHDEDAEMVVTKYNDRSGRTFGGIVDLIESTIEAVKYDSDLNVSANPEDNATVSDADYDEADYEASQY